MYGSCFFRDTIVTTTPQDQDFVQSPAKSFSSSISVVFKDGSALAMDLSRFRFCFRGCDRSIDQIDARAHQDERKQEHGRDGLVQEHSTSDYAKKWRKEGE